MAVRIPSLLLAVWSQAPISGEAPDEAMAPARFDDLGMPALELCAEAEAFGGTDLEKAALCYYRSESYASSRKLADRAFRLDPSSFRAHYLLGVSHHQGEGNLPKALFHLETAEKLLIERHGERPPPESSVASPYAKILLHLVYVHGEMDHHVEKIHYVDALSERLGLDYSPLKSWPLLKLGRFEEARAIARQAASNPDAWYRAVGATALCAVESEIRDRSAAYAACKAAAEPILESPWDGSIELSNAGAASEEMFAFDEAERYFLEATTRQPEGSVNPWGRLVRLYVRQGRLAEAVSAWRKMRAYRKSRPASYLDQQDQSEAEMIGASVLIVAGLEKEALPITARTVARPDRQGTSSANVEQNLAGSAIMDAVVRRAVARRLEEEASSAETWDALKLHVRAIQARIEAWAHERIAAEVLADPERLITSLRPECPGSVEVPAWLDGEVVRIVGPGVALAGLAEARKAETLPPALADQIFVALEAEAHLLDGDDARALTEAGEALRLLPTYEVMLRGRAAAIAAEAARREGRLDDSLAYLRLVLATDPGAIRRMGLELPVRVAGTSEGPAIDRALELLGDSPLFDVGESGFLLAVGLEEAILTEPDGSEIMRVRIPAGRQEDDAAVARRIVRAIHGELLVPSVDITQADIRSLDGSLGGGGRASDRAKSILEEVSEEPEPVDP
jgi:tetratricopeptide (TPR) repeat protein